MNNERIQEIKQRWQAEMDAFQNHDIAYLLSEVERLQRENEAMMTAINDAYACLCAEHPLSAESTLEDFISHLKG